MINELSNAFNDAASLWHNPTLRREDQLDGLVNKTSYPELVARNFNILPEVVQLLLSIRLLSLADLNKLAIKEGFLDIEERSFLTKDVIIAVIAGSINRGSTAESTSSFRIGSQRYNKEDV